MRLITAPRTPPFIRLVSWVAALLVTLTIVYLVFKFGYYASGLAAFEQDQKIRSKTPIPLKFADPNAPSDQNTRADPNARTP